MTRLAGGYILSDQPPKRLPAQASDRYPTSSESPSPLSDAKYSPPVGAVQCCSNDEVTFEMESKAQAPGNYSSGRVHPSQDSAGAAAQAR